MTRIMRTQWQRQKLIELRNNRNLYTSFTIHSAHSVGRYEWGRQWCKPMNLLDHLQICISTDSNIQWLSVIDKKYIFIDLGSLLVLIFPRTYDSAYLWKLLLQMSIWIFILLHYSLQLVFSDFFVTIRFFILNAFYLGYCYSIVLYHKSRWHKKHQNRHTLCLYLW